MNNAGASGRFIEHLSLLFIERYFQTFNERCRSVLERSLNIHLYCSLNVIFKHSMNNAGASGRFIEHLSLLFIERYFQTFNERCGSVLERSLNIHL